MKKITFSLDKSFSKLYSSYRKELLKEGVILEEALTALEKIGLSPNEARVFLTIYKEDGKTGYKISKDSGIARSKIYPLLSSLVEKGLIFQSKEEPIVYRSLTLKELVAKLDLDRQKHIQDVRENLTQLDTKVDKAPVWQLASYEQAMERALYEIQTAQKSLYVQIYTEDLTPSLIKALERAESRLHDFVVILFSQHHRYSLPFRRYYKHYFEAAKKADYHGRWLSVVADSQAVVSGRISEEAGSDLLWTQNSSMVFMAQEYVLHDAYNLRTLNKLDKEAREVFGADLADVRDIYFDW